MKHSVGQMKEKKMVRGGIQLTPSQHQKILAVSRRDQFCFAHWRRSLRMHKK